MTAGLIAALDTADIAQAATWARQVSPYCGMVKLGLEFYLANGTAGFRALGDVPIFLDLKLHDIPNTVAGAIRSVLPLAPRLVTLHMSGGPKMIEAARREAERAGDTRPKLLAVTVLTSLDDATLHLLGVEGGVRPQVMRLAKLAIEAGADGIVCSAHEVAALRVALGPMATLVVPGIRPEGYGADDQARTMTPRAATDAGADWLVVGRPITASADPAAAAHTIAASMTAPADGR